MTQCDLPALLQDLASEYPPGRVRCSYEAQVQSLDCDAGMLRIALRNLLANADRHCEEGAAVSVTVREDGEMLRIAVSNPGSGIPAAEQERLFQKYYRGQNALRHPGAGLGLYLVSSIAQRLGGSVALEASGGDEPVRFCLSLPHLRGI
ncbi:Alginate biosynthesis sensor protein KinB [compost metagenome]